MDVVMKDVVQVVNFTNVKSLARCTQILRTIHELFCVSEVAFRSLLSTYKETGQILEPKTVTECFLHEREKIKTNSGKRGCKSFTTVVYSLFV